LNLLIKEGRLLLALQAIEKDQFQSLRSAAATYGVSKDTLKRRRAGTTSRRDSIANSRNMTTIEESIIVQHIIDLDSRGFPPTPQVVAEMANKLRSERGMAQVGPNWVTRFIKRTPELKNAFLSQV